MQFIKSNLSWLLFIVGIISLYCLWGNPVGEYHWQSNGKKRYQLLSQLYQIGDYSQLVKKMQNKLKQQPDDTKGWLLLSRIYYAGGEYDKAQAAFMKAESIEKSD